MNMVIITMENNLSPLNSQVYLMQEAIKYGQELKNVQLNHQVCQLYLNVVRIG